MAVGVTLGAGAYATINSYFYPQLPLHVSAAGIHALMQFTVQQRRREIGIRSALGASARGILMSILPRERGSWRWAWASVWRWRSRSTSSPVRS